MASRSFPVALERMLGVVARAGSVASGVGLYLIATFLCLAAGWWLPGRGIDAIVARLVLGCAAPAVAVMLLQRRLGRAGHDRFATALLVGMIVMGVACVGAAIGVILGFRILDS